MFTLHVNVFKGDRRTLRNSRLTQIDCRTGTSGVNRIEHLVNRLQQDILRAMMVGNTLEYNSQKQRDLLEFRWEGPDLVMDGSQVIPHTGSNPQDYRFGINVVLALKMKWLVANVDRTYGLGPRLLLQFPRYPVEADQLNNKTFEVDSNGMVYLALVYTWCFVHLNDSFQEVTGWNGSSGYQPWLRPVHLYCNVGESSIVGTQITNFM